MSLGAALWLVAAVVPVPPATASECGGNGQRICIPGGCNRGLTRLEGKCYSKDADGFPDYCGRDQQPTCKIPTQRAFGVSFCKPHLVNWVLKCYSTDDEGFPSFCGHEQEQACPADVRRKFNITACHSGLYEDTLTAKCLVTPKICVYNNSTKETFGAYVLPDGNIPDNFGDNDVYPWPELPIRYKVKSIGPHGPTLYTSAYYGGPENPNDLGNVSKTLDCYISKWAEGKRFVSVEAHRTPGCGAGARSLDSPMTVCAHEVTKGQYLVVDLRDSDNCQEQYEAASCTVHDD